MISHSYQGKQERGIGKKAHLTDMLRDVWTRAGLAQNHTSLLGVVEVKAVLQLKAYQSLVCICSTELLRNKMWELKEHFTGFRQEEKSRYGKRGEHKKQHKHYVWEKPRHTKCPCAVCLEQFISHLLWLTSITSLTSFIFPLTSDSPKT